MSTLTSKTFITLAKIIASEVPNAKENEYLMLKRLTTKIADYLQDTNPKFIRDRFTYACIGETVQSQYPKESKNIRIHVFE